MSLDCCLVLCGAVHTSWNCVLLQPTGTQNTAVAFAANVDRSLWPRPQHPQLPLPKQYYYGALSLLLLVVLAIVVAVFVHLVVP
jgi:hypothetical protein